MSDLTEHTEQGRLHKALGTRDLVLLNIAAILGLRWLSTSAQLGPSSLIFWFLALIVFFIPSGLAVMELGTRLPGEGGIYLWTKRAFGDLHGFIAGWTYWINNLFYFPSLLLFISGVFLFLGGDRWLHLDESALYNAAFCLLLLWLVIGLNIIGLERGKWVQNVGAVTTWIVFIILLVVGITAWVQLGSSTSFEAASFSVDLTRFSSITFFATITFAFAGLELGPVMAGEIREPRKAIPRSLLTSGVIITAIYVLGTALLMVAVPEKQIDVISGIPQAFAALQTRIGVPLLGFFGALLVVVSSTGGLSAWVNGVARIPFVVGIDRYLPEGLGRIHPEWGSPHIALIVQGVLATALLLAATAGSTIEEAYIILLDMTIILYFIPFLYEFAALPVLRRNRVGDEEGVTLIPGGMPVVWLVSVLGFAATALSIVLAMIPPEGTQNPSVFVGKTIGGTVLFLAIGLIFYWRGVVKKKRRD